MIKLYTIAVCFLCFLLGQAYGQTATEALRLSQSNPLGSGRNLGVGNSMYSIGADLSAVANNPAGIGAYWRSEFMGTMNVTWNPYDTHLQGDSTRNYVNGSFDYFRIPNLGFVIANRSKENRLSTSNWVIGVNRVAEYAQEIQFRGFSPGSITDSWQENAKGKKPAKLNGFEEGLAYSSGAIYDFESDYSYESDNDVNPDYPVYKEEFSTVRGGNSELTLGYGANLSSKFLFGLSFNIPLVNVDVNRLYRETDKGDGIPIFNNLQYTSYVNTSGSGINGKFGFIIKASKNINLSFAAHTPTRLHLTDNYNTTVTFDYTDQQNNGPITSESPYGSFRYALRTPWKLVGGIGIIAGTNGFLSAGVKWTDYSSMRFDYSVPGNGNYYYQEELDANTSIRQQYGSVFELNMGGEIAFKYWRLRGGFSAVQSPYLNDDSFDPTFHGGIGYRAGEYYVDLAYSYSRQQKGYLPYSTKESPQPVAVTEYHPQNIVMTLGLKF